jgi:hypothetical protein
VAPRKTPQTPSEETPDKAKEDATIAASGDDTLADDTTAETPVATTETDVTEPETAEKPETVSGDADSIELPEPDREAEKVGTPDEGTEETTPAETPETEPETESDATPEAEELRAEEDWPGYKPDDQEGKGRGAIIPMLIGGVAAAAIGFFAATLTSDGSDLSARLTAQSREIEDLKAAMPQAVDTAPLETAASDNAAAIADLTTRVEDLSAQIAALSDRMTELEKAPLADAVPESVRQAYEEELARLQDSMRAQRAEVEALVENAQQMRAAASAEAAETQARAALTQILSAMNNGQGFVGPLSDLRATGVKIPAPLIENVEGVASLADLRADFPPAARNALAVSRGVGNDSVGGFFRTQLGIRSLEPKDGDDPDAILSRAEAAIEAGDLPAALEEIGTLPPEAQAELATWVAQAETRLTTVDAAHGLMAELNSN